MTSLQDYFHGLKVKRSTKYVMITIIKDYNEYVAALCDTQLNGLHQKHMKAYMKEMSKQKNLEYKDKRLADTTLTDNLEDINKMLNFFHNTLTPYLLKTTDDRLSKKYNKLK